MKEDYLVELYNVTLHRQRKELLSDVSLRVKPGRLVAVIGPNGAGKSSLLKAILGIWQRSSGVVRVLGHRLEQLAVEQRARIMAYVPQQSALNLPWTVREVVQMGLFVFRHERLRSSVDDEAAVHRALIDADVAALAGRDFMSLSGGERGRVLLARAMATEAPLLMLDEPTHSLDMAHATHCMVQLRRLRDRGQSIIMVTHDLNQLSELADEVVVMRRGRVCLHDTPRRVLQDPCLESVLGVRLIPRVAYGYARLTDSIGGGTQEITRRDIPVGKVTRTESVVA